MQQAQALQKEIGRRQDEMGRTKLSAAKSSSHPTSGRPVFHKEVVDHLAQLQRLQKELSPVRLRCVKLQRHLELCRLRWEELGARRGGTGGHGRVDAMEVAMETRIFEDRAEGRAEEIFQMQKTVEEDVIVASHTRMKLAQQGNANRQLREKVEGQDAQLQEVSEGRNRLEKYTLMLGKNWQCQIEQVTTRHAGA